MSKQPRSGLWKALRVAILLVLLALVANTAWLEQRRVHAWAYTLDVGAFPVAGDDSPVTRDYLARLERSEFTAIDGFFLREARAHGLGLSEPVRVTLYPAVAMTPPAPPAGGGVLSAIVWSLSLRYYAFRSAVVPSGAAPAVRLFVVYHDPALTPRVPHSTGLDKGLIGVAHVFALARMSGSNAVVIAHEFLHTLGATDKYDPATDAPVFPTGYGDPAQLPRYPQARAEIMAGRIALSPTAQDMPESLDSCVIGRATATEISWLRH